MNDWIEGAHQACTSWITLAHRSRSRPWRCSRRERTVRSGMLDRRWPSPRRWDHVVFEGCVFAGELCVVIDMKCAWLHMLDSWGRMDSSMNLACGDFGALAGWWCVGYVLGFLVLKSKLSEKGWKRLSEGLVLYVVGWNLVSADEWAGWLCDIVKPLAVSSIYIYISMEFNGHAYQKSIKLLMSVSNHFLRQITKSDRD